MKKGISIISLWLCFSIFAFGQTSEVFKSDGISAETQEQYEVAAKAFEAAANAFKEQNIIDTISIYRAGYNYARIDQYEKAIPFLQECIDLKYNEGRASRLLSDTYFGLKNIEKAETVLLTGKINCPEDQFEFDKKLAYLYLNSKQYEKAVISFEKVHRTAPENKNYAYLYGLSMERVKKYEQAIDIFTRLQQQFPNDSKSKKMLGITLFEQADEQNERIVKNYETKQDARIKDYIVTKRKLEEIDQKYDKARLILEESLADFPENKQVINTLYLIYRKQSKEKLAAEMKSRLQ